MGAVRGSWCQLGFACAVAASLLALACGRTAKTDGDDDEPIKDPPNEPDEKAPNCAVALAGNDGRHCAVYQDGSVWCWGAEGNGEGPSNFERSAEPRKVAGVTHAQRVVVGPRHSCAVTETGVLCWGDNESAQVDDSGLSPREPTSPGLWDDQAAPMKGIGLGDTQTCSVNLLSHVSCRGKDISGVASAAHLVSTPGPWDTTMPGSGNFLFDDKGVVFELADWTEPNKLAAYGNDNAWYSGAGTPTCVLKRTGSLWCTSSQPGGDQRLMVEPDLGERVVQAGTGTQFLCALSEGKVWCEGPNRPDRADAEGDFVAGVADVRSISVNDYSVCALKADGSVWCWGNYAEGLRTGTPTQVSGCEAQTTQPLGPPPLFMTAPLGATRLGEASLARAQAMCECGFGSDDFSDSCIVGEDHAPISPCLSALTPDDNTRHDCLANLDWQDALCYAQQTCEGTIQTCPFGADCPPPKRPQAEQYCRRRGCVTQPNIALPKAAFCDGVRDCSDGTDEWNCRDDLGGAFECNPESRIQLTQLCDGTIDCDNGSDEAFCP